jgi:hypothetical protein
LQAYLHAQRCEAATLLGEQGHVGIPCRRPFEGLAEGYAEARNQESTISAFWFGGNTG